MSSSIRSFLFRKHAQWNDIRVFLLPSIIASAVGAAALFAIPDTVLLSILFLFAFSFLIKKIRRSEKKPERGYLEHMVSFLSGFFQGMGLGGSDLRNGYFYSKGYSIPQVHGTSSLIGAANFFVATIVRLSIGTLTIPNLVPILYLLPVLIIMTLVGRSIVYKIPQRISDGIIILVLTGTLLLLSIKIFD